MLAAHDKIQLVSDSQNRGCWNSLRRKLVDSKLAMNATPENVQAVCAIASEFYAETNSILIPAILLSQQVDAWPESPGPAARVFVQCACNLFVYMARSGEVASAQSSSSSSAENLQSIMDQVEYANKDLSNISRMLVNLLCQLNFAQLAIRPLMKAIKFISSQRPHVLTPMHAHLLTACVSAGHYSVAWNFLQSSQADIRSIDQTCMFLSSYDYLTYFYFAGLVYQSMSKYEDALESLVECITTPAEALSVIMVQALKQAKLISLICHQTPLSLPKYTSAVMLRASKQSLQPYDSIVKSFMDRDALAMKKTIADNFGLLEKDLCCGLAQQVLDALSDHKIRELTRTYKTLSMAEIASKVGFLGESRSTTAEKEVLRLVGGGELRARIDQQQQVAAFLDEEEFLAIFHKGGDDEQDLLRTLGDQMPKFVDETMAVGAQLRSLRTQILSSREYLSKMLSRGNASGMAGMGAAASGGWAMGVESGSGAWGAGGDEDFI